MKNEWNDIVVTKISVAVYVAPKSGKAIHKKRPFHGFVLNDANGVKDYVFDNGLVMSTEGNTLFYLPKESSYHVETLHAGGCYAINFDAKIDDKPFCVNLKNNESLKKRFKIACDEWRRNESWS